MITKQDCMSLLLKLEDSGLDVDEQMKRLMRSQSVPVDTLSFIVRNNGLEANRFYEMLRKRHNQKKSPLYKNLLDGPKSPADAALTLNCLLTQIFLYGSKLESPSAFYKEIRADEIARAVSDYVSDGEYSGCSELLGLLKTDLLVIEYASGRRELD